MRIKSCNIVVSFKSFIIMYVLSSMYPVRGVEVKLLNKETKRDFINKSYPTHFKL